ncbi:MAG: cyclophilin-like fold protein [Thermotogota bacterium]
MTHAHTIEIVIDGTTIPVELNGTKTASELLAALPLRGDGAFWGDEIYFDVGVELSEENPRADVEVGDVAYWLPGTALCLFFGRTPASTTDKPCAASPVTVVGRLVGDPARLRTLSNLRGIEVRGAPRRAGGP